VRRNRKGFTLLELLVTMVISLVIMAAAYGLYTLQTRSYLVIEEETQALQNTRLAIEQISRELRMANFGVVGREAFIDARAASISFLGDIDSDITVALAQDAAAGTQTIYVDLHDEQDTVDSSDFIFLHTQAEVEMVQVRQSGDPMDLDGEPDTIYLSAPLSNSFSGSATVVKTVETTAYVYTFGSQTLRKNGILSAEGISNLEFHYFNESGQEMVPEPLQSLDQISRASIRRIEILLQTQSPLNPATIRSYRAGVDLRNMGARGFKLDICAPQVPTALTITETGTCGHFTASWTAPTQNACDGTDLTDLGGYKIFYGNATGTYFSPAFNVSDETAVTFQVPDIRLEHNNTYYVTILAYDTSFNQSPTAGEVSFLLYDTTLPNPPENLDAASGVGTVTLTWTVPEDVDVKGYRVYRSETSGFTPGPGNRIADEAALEGVDTQFVDATVTPCKTYYYRIASVDCVGEGSPTNEVFGDGPGSGSDSPTSGATNTTPTEDPPTTPAVVDPFGATGADQSANLSWTNPSDLDFDYVVIRYSNVAYPTGVSDGQEVVTLSCAPGATSNYNHTNLSNGQVYYYSIFACDRCTNCSAPAQASATPNALGPVVEIISPPDGQVITNGELVFQARAYDPDEAGLTPDPNVNDDNGKGIQNITFHVTPDPGGTSWPRTEYLVEYCGFGGGLNPCSEGDVSQWCEGTYNLYVVATDNEGMPTQSPYLQIQVESGGIDMDEAYTNSLSGTHSQVVNFQIKNTSQASVKILGLTAAWDRAQARLSEISIPSGSSVWNQAESGGPAGSGDAVEFSSANQPSIALEDTATVQLGFVHFFTSLSVSAAAGDTQISVAASGGFSAGETLFIGEGEGLETPTIQSLSPGVIVLSTPLASSHAYGERVSLKTGDSEMPMSACEITVSFTYEMALAGQQCTTDDMTVIVSAGPLIGTPRQDEPADDTQMSTTVGLLHVENFRPVDVHTVVTDYSGTGISSVAAYYKVDTSMLDTPPATGYATLDMTYNGGTGEWEATAPFASDARLWIYFVATDGNGATDRSPASGAYTWDLDPDTTPPACPLGLTATAMGASEIKLQWQKSPEEDVIGYNVYRSDDCGPWHKKYTLVTDSDPATPDVIDFTDDWVGLNTSKRCYVYHIRAVDSSDNQSADCLSYSAQAGDCPCP